MDKLLLSLLALFVASMLICSSFGAPAVEEESSGVDEPALEENSTTQATPAATEPTPDPDTLRPVFVGKIISVESERFLAATSDGLSGDANRQGGSTFQLLQRKNGQKRGNVFLRLSSDPSSYVFITEDGMIKYGAPTAGSKLEFEVKRVSGRRHKLFVKFGEDTCYIAFQDNGQPVRDACSEPSTANSKQNELLLTN